MSKMSPVVYTTYMLSYCKRDEFRSIADVRNLVRLWNAESKGYSDEYYFRFLKKKLAIWRKKQGHFKEWKNFNVPQYMKFINDFVHFGI